MQMLVDIKKEDDGDWNSCVGDIAMISDLDGRIYIEADGIEIGFNLPDLMRFIQQKIFDGIDAK